MIQIILSILFLITAIPVGLILNYYTRDEKYLKEFIKYLSIVLIILIIVSFIFFDLVVSLTLTYMVLIGIISYWKKVK